MNEIRERQRLEVRRHQSEQRGDLLDRKRCGLSDAINEEARLTEKDVAGLAARLKRRKRAEENDLKRLTAAFLHSGKNVSEFCRITGALNVVMKEFTGTDTELQLLAAECLCNLALGEDACSKKVATAAGTYLLLYLTNTTESILMETCLWTVQNLLLSGPKTGAILLSQGVVPRLLSLIRSKQSATAALMDTEGETLAILVDRFWPQLPLDAQQLIPVLLVDTFGIGSDLYLNALYNCLQGLNYDVEPIVLDDAVQKSINYLISICSLPESKDGVTEDINPTRLVLSIRILTNAFAAPTASQLNLFSSVIAALLEKKLTFSGIVQRILTTNNETVIKEALWMAATLYCCALDGRAIDSDMYRYFTQVDPLAQTLKLPTKFC